MTTPDIVIPDLVIPDLSIVDMTKFAATVPPSLPTAGLLAHWTMDQADITGGVISDRSGNGVNGTVNNAPTAANNRNAEANKALTFNGTTQDIDGGNNVDFASDDPWTISIWINTNTVGDKLIVGKERNSSPYTGYAVLMSSGEVWAHVFGTNSLHRIRRETILTYNDSAWHHICVTYDGSSDVSGLLIYIDNSAVATTASSNSLTTSSANTYNLNTASRQGNLYFLGTLDDQRIYNRVLTILERTQLFNE